MSGGTFFSRWSRRKRDVEQAEKAEPRPLDPAEDASGTVEPVGGAETDQTTPSESEMSPEEIAALPLLDAFTPETDLTVFFRKGVPQALRNAALRRMWSLDPAIRDHVGDARDYAWDWNTAGGVPGFEPLSPADDVYATLDQMFSPAGSSEAGQTPEGDYGATPGQSVAPLSGDEPDPQHDPVGADAEPAPVVAAQQSPTEPLSEATPVCAADETFGRETALAAPTPKVAAPQQAEPDVVWARPRRHVWARPRRHGGAAPD